MPTPRRLPDRVCKAIATPDLASMIAMRRGAADYKIDDSVDCPPGQGGIMYALPYR